MVFTRACLTLLFSCLIGLAAQSQDTLPKFSVKDLGNNRFVIGWVNAYPVVKQISIQRSHDSLKNFRTIMSVADPKALQNGFLDTKAPNDHMYYRLFINLDKGEFFFTESKKPVKDTTRAIPPTPHPKDTTVTTVIKPPVIKKPDFVPSFYVYTNKQGYVYINLPDAARKKYSIKFFEDNGSHLFDIKSIKDGSLTLDKANFLHAGWFHFELYEDEKLIEKNKFYLAKEF